MSQVCRTCGVEKPLTEYWRQPVRKCGFQSECKPCGRARNQRWIDNNRERFRAMNRTATSRLRRRNPLKSVLSLARARCRRTGMEFTISEADISIPERCPVLGMELGCGLGKGEGHELKVRDSRYSLDRIDNSRGYVPGNVVVVSYRVNRIKSDATIEELRAIVDFYDKLATNKGGEVSLPDVQSPSQEKAGEMSLSIGGR